jgi:hypothetical protein
MRFGLVDPSDEWELGKVEMRKPFLVRSLNPS